MEEEELVECGEIPNFYFYLVKKNAELVPSCYEVSSLLAAAKATRTTLSRYIDDVKQRKTCSLL